jgi:hypothetical protein
MNRRFSLGARKLKFICCVKRLFLFLLLASSAQAQFISPGSGSNQFGGFNDTSSNGPTNTPTWDPMIPTYTVTPTPTYNPFAAATDTPTPGSPTDTPTYTFTPTQTGTINTPTATWSSTPMISRASLVMLPTAYSNGRDYWTGFNWDLDFTYYIGSIISQDYTQQNGFDSLNQINVVLLTSDTKYAWLDDNGDTPGIASGVMVSLMAQVGTSSLTGGPTATPTFGTSSGAAVSNTGPVQVVPSMVGGIYTVISKKISKNTAVHFGYIYGLSRSSGTGILDYGSILPLFAPGLTHPNIEYPNNLFYAGFNTRFWDRNWKFEIWKPFSTDSNSPYESNPILFNTLIDGLPMAFNLGYERWDTGFAVLGYINFRLPIFPSESDY